MLTHRKVYEEHSGEPGSHMKRPWVYIREITRFELSFEIEVVGARIVVFFFFFDNLIIFLPLTYSFKNLLEWWEKRHHFVYDLEPLHSIWLIVYE